MAINQTLPQGRPHRTKFDAVYDSEFFYSQYDRKYSPELLGLKGKRPVKIDKSLYDKILREYWDLYFKEIYFLNKPIYFLYTGSLEKVLCSPTVIKTKIKKVTNSVINLFWSKRPNQMFFCMVKFAKLTGKQNAIPKIELMYKNNFDINLIANFEQVIKEARRNDNLYLK